MTSKTPWLTLLLAFPALANVITGVPDPAPPGFEQWVSPVITPAPPVVGTGDWASAVARARKFVAGLTLEEKINVTTGIDIVGPCVGNTGVRFTRPSILLSVIKSVPRIRRQSRVSAGTASACRTRRSVSASRTSSAPSPLASTPPRRGTSTSSRRVEGRWGQSFAGRA
jgi:hypothetical protein